MATGDTRDLTSVLSNEEMDSSWQQATGQLFERWLRLVKDREGSVSDLVVHIRRRLGEDIADQFEEWYAEGEE